jgi:hypothetical protein
VKTGIEEGWAASGELDGPKYRRGKVRILILSFNARFTSTARSKGTQCESHHLLQHPLIHDSNNRYLRPLQQRSTCPSRQSSSTRKKPTPANTTSTHTARSTASYRSIRHSNWKVCQSERTGRDQAGQVWHLARIIILVPEVGGELRFSSCPVAGLRMMRNRGSHSRRTSECFCWSTVQMF